MRWVWAMALCAVVGGAGDAIAQPAAEDDGVLAYNRLLTDKVLRALLPAGAPSTKVRLLCVAGRTRFTECRTLGTEPAGRDDVAAAATKLALTQAYQAKDRNGRVAEGRTFTFEPEFVAPGDRNPDWLRRPTPDTLRAVFPKRAMVEGRSGGAQIRCRVTVEGYLDRCTVLTERPAGYGFGEAALLLSAQFVMTPKIRGGKPVPGEVTIPVDWAGLESAGIRPGKTVVRDPIWRSTPSPAEVRAAFPAKAAATPAGQAALRCNVLPDGHVARCQITAELPSAQGFGEAARSLAPRFTVALRPDETPPKNMLVEIPIRFRNPAAADAGRLTDVKWVQTLSEAGAGKLFPEAARAEGVMKGVGIVDCVATTEGGLDGCRVTSEEPTGKGFGQAALGAAKLLKMNPWTTTGDPVEGRRLGVPIRFNLAGPAPGEATTPTVP